jgi:hypothetical protein
VLNGVAKSRDMFVDAITIKNPGVSAHGNKGATWRVPVAVVDVRNQIEHVQPVAVTYVDSSCASIGNVDSTFRFESGIGGVIDVDWFPKGLAENSTVNMIDRYCSMTFSVAWHLRAAGSPIFRQQLIARVQDLEVVTPPKPSVPK